MPRKKKVASKKKLVEKIVDSLSKQSVDVLKGKKVIRSYSKKDHGAKFKELAQSFADQYNYSVK